MKAVWLRAPLGALLWSCLARAQAPLEPPLSSAPPPPAPPAVPPQSEPQSEPLPTSPSTESPPASAGATRVRPPDTGVAPDDQGPDTLPSLDEDQAPAPRAAPRRAPRRPRLPIRAERRLALTGELGWNGLAGFGAVVSFHANPHVSFDLGVGLAAVGGKVGLRGRFNFLTGSVTPFLGLGFMGATGFDAPTRELGDDDSELNIELKPSAFMQTVAGIDWTKRNGFTLVGALGYATMLTRDNVVIVTGVPTDEERKGLDIVFRSGIVISIAIGYSFR